jgi:O-antigen/teichoic acid export membrane protein
MSIESQVNQLNQPKPQRIFRNFSSLTASRVAGDVFTFLFFVVLSRTFGQEGVGHYSFAIALTGFLVVFADFGLYDYSILKINRQTDPAKEYYGKIFVVRFFLSVIVILFMLVLLPFLPFSIEAKFIIFLIGLHQTIYTLISILTAVFVAHEDMHLAGILEFSCKMVTATAAIGIALTGGSLILTLAVFPIVTTAYVIITYFAVAKKYGTPQLNITRSFFIQTLRQARPFAVFLGLEQLSSRIDIVFLGILLSTAAVGIYNAAYRIIFFFLILAYFAGLVLFPLASRLYLVSQAELVTLFHRSLNFAVLIAVPIVGGIWLIAPEVIELVYGEGFTESILILRYLACLIFIAFLKSIMGAFLTACDRQADRTRGQWVAAWANVLGNLLLILVLGIKGAVFALLISESLLLIYYSLRLRDLFGFPRIGLRMGISVLATVTFIITITLFETLPLGLEVFISIALYFSLLLLFKEIRQHELHYLVGVIRVGVIRSRRKSLRKESLV